MEPVPGYSGLPINHRWSRAVAERVRTAVNDVVSARAHTMAAPVGT
jgi:hypothetical protein